MTDQPIPSRDCLRGALKNVEIAFLQVEFAIKLMMYCALEKLDPAIFDAGDYTVLLDTENLNFRSGHFGDVSSIVRATEVSFNIALGASALALDQAFDAAGIKSEAKVMRASYRRSIAVDVDGRPITLNLADLHGQLVDFEQHIGGHKNWWRIMDEVVSYLTPFLDAWHTQQPTVLYIRGKMCGPRAMPHRAGVKMLRGSAALRPAAHLNTLVNNAGMSHQKPNDGDADKTRLALPAFGAPEPTHRIEVFD